jgi:hypothetical protein
VNFEPIVYETQFGCCIIAMNKIKSLPYEVFSVVGGKQEMNNK